MYKLCIFIPYLFTSDPEGHHQPIQIVDGTPSTLRTRLGLSWTAYRAEGPQGGRGKENKHGAAENS